MTVVLNKKVPDFKSEATGGEVQLSKLKGSAVVLYFYPKDNTPGCTTEGMDFAANQAKFKRAGAAIFGVSRDSMKSHEGFKAKLGLPFELISDPEIPSISGPYSMSTVGPKFGHSMTAVAIVRSISRTSTVGIRVLFPSVVNSYCPLPANFLCCHPMKFSIHSGATCFILDPNMDMKFRSQKVSP